MVITKILNSTFRSLVGFRCRSGHLANHLIDGSLRARLHRGTSLLLVDRGRIRRLRRPPGEPRRHAFGGVAGAAREAPGLQAADGVDVSLGVVPRRGLQFRLQRLAHRGATARGAVEYDYRREAAWTLRGIGDSLTKRGEGPVAEIGAMTGTDVATYTRDRPGLSAFVLEESSTTPIPPMRVGWTASVACTGASTAPPRGATRRASGGAAATNTSRFLKTPATVAARQRRTREHLPLLPDTCETLSSNDLAGLGRLLSRLRRRTTVLPAGSCPTSRPFSHR